MALSRYDEGSKPRLFLLEIQEKTNVADFRTCLKCKNYIILSYQNIVTKLRVTKPSLSI